MYSLCISTFIICLHFWISHKNSSISISVKDLRNWMQEESSKLSFRLLILFFLYNLTEKPQLTHDRMNQKKGPIFVCNRSGAQMATLLGRDTISHGRAQKSENLNH